MLLFIEMNQGISLKTEIYQDLMQVNLKFEISKNPVHVILTHEFGLRRVFSTVLC